MQVAPGYEDRDVTAVVMSADRGRGVKLHPLEPVTDETYVFAWDGSDFVEICLVTERDLRRRLDRALLAYEEAHRSAIARTPRTPVQPALGSLPIDLLFGDRADQVLLFDGALFGPAQPDDVATAPT